MLTFNLKKRWYNKIASGEKRIEYREVGPYWTKRLNKVFAIKQNDGTVLYPFPKFTAVCKSIKPPKCILRLGYTKKYMTANITKIEVVDGKKTDLKINASAYAIHLDKVERGSDCFNCALFKKCNRKKMHGKYCIAWTQG